MPAYVEWKAWDTSHFGLVTPEDTEYFRRELSVSGVGSVAGLRVGELGFGNGAFAGWVRQGGGIWTGREIIPELVACARKSGFEIIEPDVDLSAASGGGTFDLIVAFDVIEHLDLDAIRAFLLEAKRAVKPAGRLLLRMPSGDSPFSSHIFWGDLTHRTLLGSSAVRQLAAETGWSVEQIRSPVLSTTGLGVVRASRRVAVSSIRWVVFGFIRRILMGNASAVVSPNMIVVLKPAARARS